jgi:hypothetical protein
MNALRRHYGLRWKRRYPGPHDIHHAWRTAGYLLAILIAYAIVGSMDYADEQRQHAERQTHIARRH